MTDPDLQRLAAKQPRTPLAGPYGHPFHPLFVTVPIGAWVAAVVFQLASVLTDDDAEMFAEASYWLIGLGIVGALVAALFGLLDLLVIPRDTVAFRTAITHMALNLTVVVLFLVDFLIRRAQGYEEIRAIDWVLSLVALVLLGASGFLGGQLAYRYGVRVASERVQAEGYERPS